MDLNNVAQRSRFCAYLIENDRIDEANKVMEFVGETNKLKHLQPYLAEEMRSFIISRGSYEISCESKMNDGVATSCESKANDTVISTGQNTQCEQRQVSGAAFPIDKSTQRNQQEQSNKKALQFLVADVWTYERNGMYEAAKTKLHSGLKQLNLKLSELSVDLRSRLPERLRGVQKKTYKSYDDCTVTHEKEPIVRNQELLDHERKISSRREVISRACSEGRYEELQNCFNSTDDARTNHLLGETLTRYVD